MWWAEHVRSAQGISDVDLFSYREGIIDLDAEVSDGAFDFGVTEQELHGPQVLGSTINKCRLRSPQRMGAKELRNQSDVGNPIRKNPCILPCGHAPARATPTRE